MTMVSGAWCWSSERVHGSSSTYQLFGVDFVDFVYFYFVELLPAVDELLVKHWKTRVQNSGQLVSRACR